MHPNEDQLKAEVDAVLEAAHANYVSGRIESVAETIDFPVFMVTDDSNANAMATTWDREQYLHHHAAVVQEFSPDAVEALKKLKRRRQYTFLSHAIVAVIQDEEAQLEGRTTKWKSFVLLAKNNGTWRVKVQAVGGWGDQLIARGQVVK